ncbi:MAG: flagellar export protein FliJ [Lachnospiraceae bacterium]|nr:flagellar export protein FliJ [Lachnospiraceae bacterium]
MAVFRYSLQNILTIKEKIEEQCKASFAMANREYIEECDKLERLEEKKNYYEQEIKRSYEDVISIVEMKKLHESIEITKRAMEEQKIVIKKAEKKVEEEREKLNEAMKERKTFEKMKEKAFENFLEEIKKEEDKVNDELVSFRFVNKDEQ